MELRKLATAMDNAKDELKNGVTANFENEIVFDFISLIEDSAE